METIDLEARRKLRDEERKQKAAREKKEDDTEDLQAAADLFVKKHTMRAVLKLGAYYIKMADGTWMSALPKNLSLVHPEWTTKFKIAVTERLRHYGWTYNNATYSFNTCPSDVMNMVDTTGWLKPIEGQHHWIYDVLLQSLSSNRAHVADHIEHCICHKRLHPADYILPGLYIFGQGGTGKNRMIEAPLRTMFDGATVSLESKHIIGNFNHLIAGQAVALMDEGTERSQQSAVKHTVGNETMTVTEKFISPVQAANTPWYWVAGQDRNSLFLDGTDADRRFSVIEIQGTGKMATLNYWIAVHEGWIEPSARGDILEEGCARANHWMRTVGNAILKDKVQVAYWLHYLVSKHGDKPMPMALHGDDYDRLIRVQQSILPRICEAVFNEVDDLDNRIFTHINRTTFYLGFEKLSRERGYLPCKDANFYVQVDAWLKENRPDVISPSPTKADKTGKRIYQSDKKQQRLYYVAGLEDRARRNNDDDYLEIEYGKVTRWLGSPV